MKTTDITRRAARSLRNAKSRTLLTSLAIGVGAFTIMVSLAAGEGARQYADELVKSNVDPRSLFIVKDEAITGNAQSQTALREYDPNEGVQNGIAIKQLTLGDIQALEKRTDIESVRPLYDVQATYITIEGHDKKYKSEVNVYNPDVLSEKTAGALPKLGTDISDTGVVVPSSFAKALQVSEKDLVGKKLSIVAERVATPPSNEEIQRIIATEGVDGISKLATTETKQIDLTIVAVVKPPKLSFTPTEAVGIPIAQAKVLSDFTTQGTSSYQKYFAATAKAKDGTEPEAAKSALEKSGYYPQTADDLQGFLFTIVNVITGIVAGFGVIALIASIFGIINTQYISVLERTSQIGLMKALGMRGRDVSRLFRYEAAWIGFLGGLIGVILAWGLGTALNPWISKALDLGEGTNLLIFTPLSGVLLIVGLMVVAVLAGYLPARKAAKLDPIEALRTE
jgi:putative ABC transport system permease protein